MSTVLDWSRFRNGPIGPEKAFEAFTAQLFERWVRRTFGNDLTSYVLHGAGGDGGVEAFARLATGGVVGLQAKWWDGNLDPGRVRQIRGSLDRSVKIYPALTRYVVAFRQNLTKARNEEETGGVERWEAFVKVVATAHPNVTLERWDDAGLLEQLAAPGGPELRALWFEGELGFQAMELAWRKARARLGDRYLPDLHAVGEMDAVLARDLWSAGSRNTALKSIDVARDRLREARAAALVFVQMTQGRASAETLAAVEAFLGTLTAVEHHVAVLANIVATEPGRPLVDLPSRDGVWQLEAMLEAHKKEEHGTYTVLHAEEACEAAKAALTWVTNLDELIRESARPRLIAGPAGCGKTHAAAATVGALVESGQPAVLVLARDRDPGRGAAQLLGDVFDVPGWPLGRILDALEALAVFTQVSTTVGDGAYSRALLLLDGLEESTNARQWGDVLADLAVEIEQRPRIHLTLTARPEYLDVVTLPDVAVRTDLNEHSGADLPAMLRNYAARFRLTLDEVPWLGWALRSPLEVRLLAEEFAGRSITPEEGAHANLLTLFRHKLARLEDEALRRAGPVAWAPGLNLLQSLLNTLGTLCLKAGSRTVPDVDLLAAMSRLRGDFTADRVQLALTILAEHGLVDRWTPASVGLEVRSPELGLTTRHLADFVLATIASRDTLADIRSRRPVDFPELLVGRRAAAVLFAAALAEAGHFVTDVTWREPPDDIELLQAQSLALVGPARTAPRTGEVSSFLLRSTRLNRAVLRSLVVPVARIPGHPLGPRLLDEALRGLPLAGRDPLWSVPEGLDGVGPWADCYDEILDEVSLAPEVDLWDGLPLLAAWTCSSVVEARRGAAREALAVWGSVRLDQMVLLVEHMVRVDDPQVVDDVVVAALGAAAGAPIGSPALRRLARLVDSLFFAEGATSRTDSVPVRIAARGIVERACIVFPGEFDQERARATPPYAHGGGSPPIDAEEAAQGTDHFGGIVTNDLSWYVADGCFQVFAGTEVSGRSDRLPAVDGRLVTAIDEGKLAAPARLAEERARARQEAAERQRQTIADRMAAFDELRRLHREREPEATECDPSEETLLDWFRRQPEWEEIAAKEEVRWKADPPRHSAEFKQLMADAARVTGISDISPKAVRNGMIANLVRSWGWSAPPPGRLDRREPPAHVEDAIAARHPRASHGSRSAVAQFREKYVWAAVDRIAGALADRLPVWSKEENAWRRLTVLDSIGHGVADPLPRSIDGDRRDAALVGVWRPPGILPDQFAGKVNLARRAEAWLTQTDLQDPASFINGAAERWENAAILAFSHFHRAHEGCVDQLVQVRAFGVRSDDIDLLRRDAPFVAAELSRRGAWVEDGVYVSPALATWAPWLTWRGEDQGYDSFDATGSVRHVSIRPAVGTFTARFEGEWPQEPTIWMPSPMIARALGVTGMRGGRWLRDYLDREGGVVATERDRPGASFDRYQQYLALDLCRFVAILADHGLVPVWAVRLHREPTPTLFAKGHMDIEVPEGLQHHRRDVTWLVVGDPRSGVERIPVSDVLEPWTFRRRSGGEVS